MSMSDETLTCPHCGAENEEPSDFSEMSNDGEDLHIECENCNQDFFENHRNHWLQ